MAHLVTFSIKKWSIFHLTKTFGWQVRSIRGAGYLIEAIPAE
jgi:hypothetical protein